MIQVSPSSTVLFLAKRKVPEIQGARNATMSQTMMPDPEQDAREGMCKPRMLSHVPSTLTKKFTMNLIVGGQQRLNTDSFNAMPLSQLLSTQ